ncbi:Dbl homology domain-containing protein [Calocera viscosa TUFC12733]|uniref:Dbl homology domain-containing protein n=1 Tax=Calocera viscosa (strain TUFC12733) TaxID=1330018 RepID=A0A167P3C0_CALVF|nr:Dbl homology domain-containing protein [Calocera viscosa TUFC12733]
MNSAALQVLPAQHVRDDTIPSPIATPSPVTTDDPSSMSASTSAASRPDKPLKKSNPLIDLIETEKQYVDLLASIIRRVAAAWSKDNFPPKELDTMFRCVEAIYKANRTLLARLKDIGPSPSSPKALGDLLMRWIDDLEEPYERYCSSYIAGFDLWSPVQQNQKLSQMLDEVSASTSSGQAEGEFVGWTLDSLFLLPRGRLKYYKRLYSRLLKSTQPGRSDHRLLVVAVEKLDNLLEMVAARLQVNVQELDDIHRSSSGAPREQAQALERGQDVEDPNVENRLSPSPSATARQEPQTGPPELPLLPTPQKLRQMSNLDDGGHKMHDATNVPENLKNGRGVSPDPLPSVVALDSNAATGRLHPSSMSPSAGIAAPPLADRSRNGSTPSLRSVTPSNPTADADKDDRQSGSSGTIAGSQSDE